MKKNGFTLAEVLITLSIIGVVASLTLPSLMTNTGEQQIATAYRKVINSLSEAGQMNAALDGFDYTTADETGSSGDQADTKATIFGLFDSRLQISTTKTTDAIPNCDGALILRDGTALCTGTLVKDAAGYWTMLVDVNGRKSPNKVATCGEANCTTKATRHIYDQFYVTLYEGAAMAGAWSGVYNYDEGNVSQYAADYAAGLTTK